MSIVQTIENVYITLNQHFKNHFEVLVVNDGSSDQSLQKIKQTRASYVNLPINIGIGGAVQTGFIYAQKNKFDIMIQLDGDGQHKAEFIPPIIQAMLQYNCDVCVGSRYIKKEGFQSSLARKTGIRFFSWLIKFLCHLHILDTTSGFRAYNTKAIAIAAKDYPDTYPEPEALVLFSLKKLKIIEIPVVMQERKHGISSIGYSGSVFYMFAVTLNIFFTYIRIKIKPYDSNN